MKLRVLIVAFCTALSFIAVGMVAVGLGEVLDCILGERCTYSNDSVVKTIFGIFALLLFSLAWFLYARICFSWVTKNSVERKLRKTGGLVGCSCILFSSGMGLVFAFPAVILMLYIHFKVPYGHPA